MEHSIKFSGQSLEVQHRLLLFVNTSFSSLALAPLPSPCETELYYLSSYDFDFFVPLFLLLLLCLRLCIIIITIINYYWLLLTRPHRSIVVWAETQKRWRSWETAVQGARYQMGSQVVRSKYIKEKTTWTFFWDDLVTIRMMHSFCPGFQPDQLWEAWSVSLNLAFGNQAKP